MKTFEDVYQAWINENIAEAKRFVKELQKEDRLMANSATAKTKNIATVRHNFAENINSKLNVRLTA